MQFGLVMFPIHDAISPGELGQAAHELGFESLLFPEHAPIRPPGSTSCASGSR